MCTGGIRGGIKEIFFVEHLYALHQRTLLERGPDHSNKHNNYHHNHYKKRSNEIDFYKQQDK